MADAGSDQELLESKLDVHDRRQFELKLEYQPSGTDPTSEYLVEAYLFIPRSLNVSQDTWTRDAFYADLHNYVRLKTPALSFDEILTGSHAPLVQLEQRMALGLMGPESEVVYDAKMLACIVRGALRRFSRGIKRRCAVLLKGIDRTEHVEVETAEALRSLAMESLQGSQQIAARYRAACTALAEKYNFTERTRTALKLVDEYLSLNMERSFRRCVVRMDAMPHDGAYEDLRKSLMAVVLEEEAYRKSLAMKSVVAPETDNEAYTHRLSFLKKYCQNILFLQVHRSSARKNWEEVLFATAAGGAMAFALGVGLFAQSRYPQASFNFFIIAVIGYMLKDRIKEGLRRLFALYAGKFLYERTNRIVDPTTREPMGLCREKIDYNGAVKVPEDVVRLRAKDDLVTVAQEELAETVLRYRKRVTLDSEMLPRVGDGIVTGVTDIIRLNVERLMHDMDDPEYFIDYVDLDDFSVGQVKAVKSYHVDVAFRFAVDDGRHRHTTLRLVRLVIDRNGIRRMTHLVRATPAAALLEALDG